MAGKMTIEELQDYMTVAQKNQIFVNEYQPLGCFMKTTHYWKNTPIGEFIVFETTIYGRNSKGEEFFLANGTAAENMSKNPRSDIDPFRFCETSSRGRALAALGIGLQNGMSSKEDLDCGIDYTGPDAVKETKPKVKRPSLEENLKRLKLKYEDKGDAIVIVSKKISQKTKEVLNRYGFKEIDGELVYKKEAK